MNSWILVLMTLSAGCEPAASQAHKVKRMEASGVVRHADEAWIVHDGEPGAFFRLPVQISSGVLSYEPSALQRESIPGAELAMDLEGIALGGEQVFVLSEQLGALIGPQGTRYQYADYAASLGNRGLEGLAIRERGEQQPLVAALFEGGYLKPSALHPDLRELLSRRSLAAFVIRHPLPALGEQLDQRADDQAKRVELLIGRMAGPVAPGQRFRAVDLVWHQLDAEQWGWIVLLNSDGPPDQDRQHAHLWLQRFDSRGRPVGEHMDLGAWMQARGAPAGGDWEGLGWWDFARSLVLVDDTGQKESHLAVVPLPADWSSTPKLDPALELHFDSIVVDGHNDLPWELRMRAQNSTEMLDIGLPQPSLHTDIGRLRAGGLGAQFWSVYVPAQSAALGQAAHQTLEQIDLVLRLIARYPDSLELAESVADVERIQRAGRIASMLGIEGGYSIEDSLALLRVYHRLGVRYMTLTHADTTSWADSATDDPEHGGLSAFGEEVVREMNRLGMLVDLSHVSLETMRDALRVSQAPVIASHSSAFALAPHARNIPDDVLKLIAANGGVVMVNFFSGFLVRESALAMETMFEVRRRLLREHAEGPAFEAAWLAWMAANPLQAGTLSDLLDHIDHIVEVAGIDHVGLGSDFDGVPLLPVGLEDVSTYPAITRGLLARGYEKEALQKVLGLNVLAALKRAEQVALALQRK